MCLTVYVNYIPKRSCNNMSHFADIGYTGNIDANSFDLEIKQKKKLWGYVANCYEIVVYAIAYTEENSTENVRNFYWDNDISFNPWNQYSMTLAIGYIWSTSKLFRASEHSDPCLCAAGLLTESSLKLSQVLVVVIALTFVESLSLTITSIVIWLVWESR